MRHNPEVRIEDSDELFRVFGAVSVGLSDLLVVPMDFAKATRNGSFVDIDFAVFHNTAQTLEPAFDGLQLKFARM